MRKNINAIILVVLVTCTVADGQSFCKNSGYLFSQSVNHHDPDSGWSHSNFKIHIEEPRIESLDRYSVVGLDQRTGSFSLDRNRGEHVSSHLVDRDGQATILWNGKREIPSEYIEKYKLDPKTNYGYKRFYQIMYGLPMSLQNESMKLNPIATVATFQTIPAYVIETELDRPMISKNWRIYVAQSDYRLLGVELYSNVDATNGERIVFSDLFNIQNLQIPRIRNWYTLRDEYLGSDIIMKELQ
jgi:hypothetical protein